MGDGVPPISHWRALDRSPKSGKLQEALTTAWNTSSAHGKQIFTLQIGAKLLKQMDPASLFEGEIRGKWGGPDRFINVLGGLEKGVRLFNEKFGSKLFSVSKELGDIGPVVSVPIPSSGEKAEAAWLHSMVLGCIAVMVENAYLCNVMVTFNNQKLYKGNDDNRVPVLNVNFNRENARLIFLALLDVQHSLERGGMKDCELPIESYFVPKKPEPAKA